MILVPEELWTMQSEDSKASFRHSRSVITVFEVLVIELMPSLVRLPLTPLGRPGALLRVRVTGAVFEFSSEGEISEVTEAL